MPSRASKKQKKRPQDPVLLAKSVMEDLIGEKWDRPEQEKPPERTDPDHISTSYVERSNLTLRMSMRRFTRLTNGFSKKIENHAAQIAIFMVVYNFQRKHMTLGTTPAIAAGIADHVWSIEEIIGLLEARERRVA